ncbi:testis expressed 53 [Rhinolophus ferrumequinum]|uniref:Testis expressed 53 n=1 Tax=Rhinolophus ferrumequinum TaxID=59479 RepID=A0A7J7VSV4_RHIFE|nr:testis expressed 53 [Rhinolophus ferrumequinum]
MASKIFCCCCRASEGPSDTVRSYTPRNPQQYQPQSFDLNPDFCQDNLQHRHPHYSSNTRRMKICTHVRP